MFRRILLFVVVIFFSLTGFDSFSQQNTIGIPRITNYDYEKINIGAQSWMIAQDKSGITYFANSDGLVTYNGSQWNLYPLPNKTLVRSLTIAPDGKIYVGGQNEFGYFFPGANGTLAFHSLKKLLPAQERSFADVWNVLIYNKELFLRCSERIFRIDAGNKVSVYHATSEWSYMGLVNGRLYAHDQTNSLLAWQHGRWEKVTDYFNSYLITAMMNAGNGKLMVTTFKNGIYMLDEKNAATPIPLSREIVHSQIYTAVKINDGQYALGTISNGIFFIDKNGRSRRQISGSDGLQNNNIISMYYDGHSNLWLGLDQGIDMVNDNDAIQKITPTFTTPSACYAVKVYNNKLYIGTSDGLYFVPLSVPVEEDLSLSKGNFQKVDNSNGQVWGLDIYNNELFMAHHEGGFIIRGNSSIPLFNGNGTGTWLYQPVSSDTLLVGSYHGLYALSLSRGNPVQIAKLQNSTDESLRFVEIDSLNGCIWASHPYRGVYRLNYIRGTHIIQSVKLYTGKDGLPNDLDNYVYQLNHRIIFCTDNGIYRYDAKSDRFVPDEKYKNIFASLSLRSVTEDAESNLWFVSQKKLGVVHKGKIQYFSEVTGKMIKGFEFVYPFNEKNIFVGTTDGLVHINFDKYTQQHTSIHLLMSKVVATGAKDSILFNGFFTDGTRIAPEQPADEIPALAPSFNSFHFEFSTTTYDQSNSIRYAYRLAGFDKDWSNWSVKNEKDYTNLPYGKYIFHIKAKDDTNNESRVVTYEFYIRPHWYETHLARMIYMLLAILGVLVLRKYQLNKLEKQKQKFEEEQRQLQYLHQLEKEHSEREILNLQKENLENEISYKNKELASTTMHLYKRGKILSALKEKLSNIVKNMPEDISRKETTKLIRMLNEEEKRDNDWEQFSIHFDDVHNNFLSNLKKIYPDLTQSDLKICAYIKMNLSSKEIAQLLNISPKGVEVARYRLRKKLNIASPATSLYDALVGNSVS